MPKQTKLDEQSIIYQPRKTQTEKEKLKDMRFGEKLSYLWEYYKIHAAIAIVAIALIGYIVYESVTPDINTVLYAAIVNSAVDPTILDEYKEGLGEYLMLDPELEDIDLNDSYYLSLDGGSATSMQQVLITHIYAGEIDVIIAPESDFKNLAYYDNFSNLSSELPTDVYSSLTDYFYLTDTESDPAMKSYGIYLNDTDLFKDLTYNGEPYVLGIMGNCPHEDNTVEFIKYLFRAVDNK